MDPEVIRAAADSPFGILALLILVVVILALAFFRTAKTSVRILIFFVVILATIAFGFVVISEPSKPLDNRADSDNSIDSKILSSDENEIQPVLPQPWQTSGYRVPLEINTTGPRGPDTGREGVWVGTRGSRIPIHTFVIRLIEPASPGLRIIYNCGGWTRRGLGGQPFDSGERQQGESCGQSGTAFLSVFRARLEGDEAREYSLNFQCHIEGSGDTMMLVSGQMCGNTRLPQRRLEQIKVTIERR